MKTISEVRRENLKALIDEAGSQVAFAQKIDRSPAQVSQWLNASKDSKSGKRRAMSDASARGIEESCGKNIGWMDQDHTNRVAEPSPTYNVHPGPDTQGLVPLISWVQAGDWCEAIDHFQPGDAEDWYPCPSRHSSHTYALRVSGDSMTAQFGRSYPDGCLIYVDPDQRGGVVSGDRVIAKVNGDNQVTFKVFVEDGGQRFLRPLNQQYPVITQPFRILGKIIGMYMPE